MDNRRNEWFDRHVRRFQKRRIRQHYKYIGQGEVIRVYGGKGMGKTTAAIALCRKHSSCLYFSFKNLDSSIAPKIFSRSYHKLTNTSEWGEFFNSIYRLYSNHSTIIIFDDMDERNDKDEFYYALTQLLGSDKGFLFTVVLMMKRKNKIPLSTTDLEMEEMSIGDIAKSFNSLSRADVSRVFAITAGIPALVSEYNPVISFDDNLQRLLRPESKYTRFMESLMACCFRAPEGYNILIYAMTENCNRISQLSTYSGFAANKCDKYIKSLIKENLVSKKLSGEPSKGTSIYVPSNTYIKMWYKWVFPHRRELLLGLSDEMLEDIRCYIDEILVPESFTERALRYFCHGKHLDLADLENHNLSDDNYKFDYVVSYDGYEQFIKIWPQINSRCDKKELIKLINAVERECSMYDSKIYLFLNGRFSDYVWQQTRKIYHLKLVQTEWLVY